MSDYALETRNLHKKFGTKIILQDVTFNVRKQTSLVILGGSGTGKSVLIKSIMGLVDLDAGHVLIDGINSDAPDARSKCGFLFQNGALFDSLNIADNVTFILKDKVNRKQRYEIAEQKLKSVGLNQSIMHLYPSELSGGMQKRVGFARAICDNPEIIFFDEPTTGLDPIMSNIINDLIIKIRKELNATTITITHDINSMNRIATDVMMLDGGSIVWQGNMHDLQNVGDSKVQNFINGVYTKSEI